VIYCRGTTSLDKLKSRLKLSFEPIYLGLHVSLCYRWSGRLHREKISTHVAFDETLDIAPFCDLDQPDPEGYEYKLHGVVMHHGKGFGCGHYTAKCWNTEGGNNFIIMLTLLGERTKQKYQLLDYLITF